MPPHAHRIPVLLLGLLLWSCGGVAPRPERQKAFTGTTKEAAPPPMAVGRTAPDRYGIVLATFPGAGSAEAATSLRLQLGSAFPGLASMIRIHERRSGWVVAFGDYTSFDDPRVPSDIEMIRRLRGPRGNQLFPQVLLTRFRAPRSMSDLHPLDLWSVRQEYPNVDPLYTLDIAIWGDFESGQWSASKRRTTAEQYAAEVRTRGYESWFYHDEDRQLSSVTVGLFDHYAIDAETGFYSMDVEAVLAEFPERLVNGEPLMEYRNPGDHSMGMRAQQPRLVEVPLE
ncbi:MAG: hypothetical protein QGH76_02720 [Phycisphaerales bacterium]|nr:hypothetical protein [Phycisphaerales bacterium]